MDHRPSSVDTFLTHHHHQHHHHHHRLHQQDSSRWSSREDLLDGSAASNENDSLFVALYDFHGVGEEQLSLKRGQYDLFLR
ncbi:unnamed protein product [Wuchereria bancrofti]|uniref:Uncharacterized protein n=1 Tax=Wuchereria bancrofti TaxID=6293 RepID=A0A3P7E7Q3_WUCBA|nr:unnamed protein product [Wuchereria bancrofti]